MGRIIGITHRVKRTAKGEARPTMVAISDREEVKTHKLETEQDELDFVLGRWAARWRKIKESEDLSGFLPHHIRRDKKTKESKQVPASYDGLRAGDMVVMTFGGSGDRLAFAIKRKLDKIGGRILRIAPFRLKEKRTGKKDEDHILLAHLFMTETAEFQKMSDRDMELIETREAYFTRQEAMKARIGCEQRLRQRLIGKIFLSEEGGYPEETVEDEYDRLKASDAVLQALIAEEAAREAKMKKAVRKLLVWPNLFEPIKGVGEVIAARLIVAIGDIRRFETAAKLKKYCGVHVLDDGRFARRRNNELANWNNEARQAFYLLGDQFNRRPDSVWGKKLREYKAKFREKYPGPIKVKNAEGKEVTKYSDIHVHKMAMWRTLTKFTEWLFAEWRRLESEKVSEDIKKAA